MAFRKWDNKHISRFNSAVSADFLNIYEQIVDERLRKQAAEPSHRTFAASSFRCDRKSWFRVRGVTPDVPKTVDPSLQFTADIGTACHRVIQRNLKEAVNNESIQWVEVDSYLESIHPDYEYQVDKSDEGIEYQIEVLRPYPIRFACDGIVKYNGVYYLLEIKTSEFDSWDDLTDPKNQHIDQVKCYAALLKLHGVLFLYQDRQYGGLKCYEVKITDADFDEVFRRFKYVMHMVDEHLAPDPLPKGDPWCTPQRCQYYKKCSEYGR